MSASRLPWVVLAVGAAATVAFVTAPPASTARALAWAVPFVLAAGLLAARTVLSPAEVRGPLRLLLAGVSLYVVGSAVWYLGPVWFGVVLPFPSLLDAAFFAAYLLYAGFLLVALRRRGPSPGVETRLALIDAGIVTLAMSSALWVAVVAPSLANGTAPLPTAVAVGYPTFQLLLFSLAVHLVIAHGVAHVGTGVLVAIWIGGELAADVFYGAQAANGTFSYDGPLIPVWMLAYTALAAFAAHPGVVSFLQPAPATAATRTRALSNAVLRRRRLVVLSLAALVPLLLAGFTDGDDRALVAVAAVAFGLSLYSASLLAGDLAEQHRLGAELEDAVAGLRAQHDELTRLAAVVRSTSDIVVTCSPDGVVLDWNESAERVYGYPRDEAVGRHAASFLPPGEQHRYEAALAALAEQDGQARVESPVLCKDGSIAEVEATASALLDQHGETYAIVAISRDVTERNRLQRELTAHARRLDEAQRVAGVGSWEWDLGTDEVVSSAELYRIFSMEQGVPVSPRVFLDRVHPDDRDRVEQEIRQPDAGMDFETRIVREDGVVRWLAVRGEVVSDEHGIPVRKTGTAQDVTERVLLHHDLVEQARRLDEAQRLAGVGSFERDLATGREAWSSQYYRIFGIDEGAPVSYDTYLERLHPEDRPWVQQQIELLDTERPLEYETRIVRPDGQVRWIAVRSLVHTDRHGVPVGKTGTALDITDRKAAEAKLERLALTDSLTGLPNRDGFTSLLRSALAAADGEHGIALLLLDLDGFKDVNDGIGHHAGDLVLQEVGRRVRAVLRDRDMVARLGGDEFAVVLPAVERIDDAVGVARKIRECLTPAFELDGMAVHVGASVGIVLDDGEREPGALLKRADVAMYRAKTLSSGLAVFAPDEDDLAVRRLAMVTDLRAAIEAGSLGVAYQPVLDTRSRRVVGFEALARWHHPDKGMVPPDQFIPLAEQADLIVPLTRLVLGNAAAACARWRAAGHDLTVAVNLSVQAMQTADVRAMAAQALAEADLDPQHLVMEITESSLATEGERVAVALAELRALGVTLVIDDFGTGFSAMSYLKELPVTGLKIDRSFVRHVASDARDLAIVRSLVRLAHSLSLRVVAEGVESAPALEVLAGLGCDFAQGYGIAKPMPEPETAGWLARYDARAATRAGHAEPRDLLVVDDSGAVRARLSALAGSAGWQVREAASAEDALREVERAIPDVVVLDHFMGGMSGMDAVPELRARGVDGPILLFTQFLSQALPSLRVPLDVWPVSKSNPDAVLELLEGYRASRRLDARGDEHEGVSLSAHDVEHLRDVRQRQPLDASAADVAAGTT